MNNKVRISDIQPNPKEAGIWIKPTEDGKQVKVFDTTANEFVGGGGDSNSLTYFKISPDIFNGVDAYEFEMADMCESAVMFTSYLGDVTFGMGNFGAVKLMLGMLSASSPTVTAFAIDLSKAIKLNPGSSSEIFGEVKAEISLQEILQLEGLDPFKDFTQITKEEYYNLMKLEF